MNAPEKPLFVVTYSARHDRCGELLERADHRVVSKEDLIRWSQGMLSEKSLNVLPLHCHTCEEDIAPTHLRIIAETDPTIQLVVPRIEIKKFNPTDWVLPKDY